VLPKTGSAFVGAALSRDQLNESRLRVAPIAITLPFGYMAMQGLEKLFTRYLRYAQNFIPGISAIRLR
jgi:hypothetical protein